jgi:hypothetical protein
VQDDEKRVDGRSKKLKEQAKGGSGCWRGSSAVSSARGNEWQRSPGRTVKEEAKEEGQEDRRG